MNGSIPAAIVFVYFLLLYFSYMTYATVIIYCRVHLHVHGMWRIRDGGDPVIIWSVFPTGAFQIFFVETPSRGDFASIAFFGAFHFDTHSKWSDRKSR